MSAQEWFPGRAVLRAENLARPEIKHLNIVVTGPVGANREFVLAPVCSVYAGGLVDKTCILSSGDHTFIRHESYVAYRHCTPFTAEELQRRMKLGYLTDKGAISRAVLERITAGITRSSFTPPYIRRYFQ